VPLASGVWSRPAAYSPTSFDPARHGGPISSSQVDGSREAGRPWIHGWADRRVGRRVGRRLERVPPAEVVDADDARGTRHVDDAAADDAGRIESVARGKQRQVGGRVTAEGDLADRRPVVDPDRRPTLQDLDHDAADAHGLAAVAIERSDVGIEWLDRLRRDRHGSAATHRSTAGRHRHGRRRADDHVQG